MNQVILTTDKMPIVYNDTLHTTKMEPVLIYSVDVGENINAYGKTIMNQNGINKVNYLHFNKGIHVLEPPVMFLSFHIDKIDKKII
jgi:hypothetical protein